MTDARAGTTVARSPSLVRETTLPRIYLSYRRDDTAGHAGRLYDRLAAQFGQESVFLDVSSIEPGVEFARVIEDAIDGVDAVVVLIGRRWLDRIGERDDFIRHEVAAALRRGVTVVPVLVEGAAMPSPAELSPELAQLAYRQALELSAARWDHDVAELVSALGRVGGLTEPGPPRPEPATAAVAPDSLHDRAQAVRLVMRDVDFAAAATDLPAVALALAHRRDDGTLARRVDELRSEGTSDRAKALSLGFAIAEVVGVDGLGAAVESLGESIRPRPPEAEPAQRGLELFYSYSHRDEKLREELEKHLTILRRQAVIRDWHDRKITAGTEWQGQIDKRLEESDLILLLISADFVASEYCYDIELARAMERHEGGDARVIPIFLRPVYWKGAPFGKLQALPTDAKAVTQYENRDEAFTIVTEGIAEAAAEFRTAA